MRAVFVMIILAIIFPVIISAQDEVKTKHDAYYLCINNIETKPVNAYGYCSNYLKKYPNDDTRLVEFAGMFTRGFEKIDRYLRSIPNVDFVEGSNWSIYKPDLQKVIPNIDDEKNTHKISITREYASWDEEKLLNRAEAIYSKREAVSADLYKQWRYYAQTTLELPAGEPKWWNGSHDSILSTDMVTTAAVLYYYNLSHLFRTNGKKIGVNSFIFSYSELKYLASIKKLSSFERSGNIFVNVYVANMTLSWGQTCGGLCGAGFTRNKIVVMKPDGEILYVFLDDPENNKSWVS